MPNIWAKDPAEGFREFKATDSKTRIPEFSTVVQTIRRLFRECDSQYICLNAGLTCMRTLVHLLLDVTIFTSKMNFWGLLMKLEMESSKLEDLRRRVCSIILVFHSICMISIIDSIIYALCNILCRCVFH